ncbi:MAG: ECF transporter S component [Candidatus Nanoarchaeia archaeon]|nr:ECF transporter S component [Candidatus Nanoarchaeia archaeon]
MEYKNLFSFNIKWSYKTVSLLLFLIFLPNLLGLINIPTVFGFKIHFFQLAIFIAALLYGPKAGLLSGLIGSLNSAIVMNNPYIIVGNAILGFFFGLFLRKGLKTIYAVLLAFLIQIPWLVLTDYFLLGLSVSFILTLLIALLISNIVWAVIVNYSKKPLMGMVE